MPFTSLFIFLLLFLLCSARPPGRHLLSVDEDLESLELRSKISNHRLRLAQLKREASDLKHENEYFQREIDLKQGQKEMQHKQVRLSKALLEDKEKEIDMYKLEAPKTLQRYNELVDTQRNMQDTLISLHKRSQMLEESRDDMVQRIHALTVGDLVEKHARALPNPLGGALRKSAAALVPFFDYLSIAADTNNRLVDHVGMEIDRYTHVNVTNSPFLSGILFYCVLLIPLVTIISLINRLANSSTNLTATHYINFANLYFMLISLISFLISIIIHTDFLTYVYIHHEHAFILANLMLAICYIAHLTLLLLQSAVTLDQVHIAQFFASLSVAIHYFLCTWRNVFTDTPPVMYWCNYLIYATIFSFILYQRFGVLSDRQIDESRVYRIVHDIVVYCQERAKNLPDTNTIRKQLDSYLERFSRPPMRKHRRHDRDRSLLPTPMRKKERRFLNSDSEDERPSVGIWGMLWGGRGNSSAKTKYRRDLEQDGEERRERRKERDAREGREGRRKSRRSKHNSSSFWSWF